MPICKVATNSLNGYFASVMYGPDLELTANQTRKKLNDEFSPSRSVYTNEFIATGEYKTYYKIAFVRSPWTRAVASFRELLRRQPFGWLYTPERYGLAYEEIYDLMQGYISFDNFIDFIVNIERDHTDIINHHWRPQVDCLSINYETHLYDFVGKLENIDDDLKHVQEHLGLEKTGLQKQHVTPAYNYKLYYQNSKTIDMVGEYYEHDIEEFNYDIL